ncbi:MAG: DNA repair protein RecO [Elusimicrobiota bacterium]|jgi:recombinational DNA repair protein (RecF pathway)
MIQNLRAIVLWSRRSRDADKVIGFFTREKGRLTVRATSAARSIAKFAALTEPFVESDVAIYSNPDHGWGKLVGGRLMRSFPALRTDMGRSTAAAWVCEIVSRLTPEEQPSPEKYNLLAETLTALETASRFSVVRLAFAVRFLSYAGFGLDHRTAWQELQQRHPDWAQALAEIPLASLGESQWNAPAVTALEQLAGMIVSDHLNRPLSVNRFRQMTGVQI